MLMKKTVLLFISISLLLLVYRPCSAQTEIDKITIDGGNASVIKKFDRSDIIRDTKMEVGIPTLKYGKEYDDRLKEMDAQMEERKWSDEQSAWNRACELDSRISYQKYIDRFPNGLHRGDAEKRIIDFDVDAIFKGDFDDLPIMERVKEDNDSPNSVVMVENHTEYELTVMYRGIDNKMIKIPPGGKGSIALSNGRYQVAAYVPPKWVRPYAGMQDFEGGTYETGYWIVQSR